jgi:uncharacterized membrane protein
MTWLQRHRIRHFLTNSIWILPSLGMVAAIAAVRMTHRLDEAMGLKSQFSPDGMRTLLGTLAGAIFTIVVFVCSALLIAVQLASASLTPRIITFVFRDRITKYSLALFVFIFTFSLAVLIRVDESAPKISSEVAVYGFMVSLVVFLFLIDHVGKSLRPNGCLRTVARLGRHVIEDVYPRHLDQSDTNAAVQFASIPRDGPCRTIANDRDGMVLALDVQGLRALAERADCVIELVPQVGDFVAVGDPLFRVFGVRPDPSAGALTRSVAIGQERTPEQDPTFAFRILVDVASKALSPAINDPTTAVLAIDQIHHLLRNVGGRSLEDERVRDATGRLRLVYRTPDWADFVKLAVTEIRQFGDESVQIARRLRAMLENLLHALPKGRAPLLQQELDLIRRSVEKAFPEPEDRALAGVSDMQGVGGKRSDG